MNVFEKLLPRLQGKRLDPERLPGLPLEGIRLRVRPFRREDEERRQQWAKYSEPYFTKYNFTPHSREVNEISFLRLRDRLRLSVDDSSGQLVGYVSLKPVKNDPDCAELGICFAADQVDKGYGRETMELVMDWAVHALDLRRLVLDVDAVNRRAIRLYEQVGFRKVTEMWKAEDTPALVTQFRGRTPSPGFRWKKSQLQVLTWVMEWTPDLESGF
ncbi:MAG: N-acetyltransferase [Candidatus Zixiibacteriota bacterium]|nr:MAG: N-acetyltransferase [candidate division Zixibacteria bacterium]